MNKKWELIGKQGTAIWCGDEIIAQVTEPRVDHGKKRKRAQLIAAAPDLLDLATALLSAIEMFAITNTSDEDTIGVLSDAAREVIAKAQGAA